MDLNKFTVRAQAAITQAQTLAAGNGQQQIETGHLLKGLLIEDADVTPFLLKKLNVNVTTLTAATMDGPISESKLARASRSPPAARRTSGDSGSAASPSAAGRGVSGLVAPVRGPAFASGSDRIARISSGGDPGPGSITGF